MTDSSTAPGRRFAKLHPTGGGRPPPRAHPTVETLVTYARRAMAKRRSGQVQDHLACCDECASLVIDLIGFEFLEPPTPEHNVSHHELRRRRRELARRLAAVAR